MSLTIKVLASLLGSEISASLHGSTLLSLAGMSARVLLTTTGVLASCTRVLASCALMSTGVSTSHYKY